MSGMMKVPRGAPLEERIAARLRRSENGCLLWTGKLHDKMGYARIWTTEGCRYVHKAAWEIAHGPVPDGMVLLHSCDTPSCANIEHLSLGTQRDNVADMFKKGRADRRGERSNTAHLTWEQVRELRQLAAAGVSRKALQARFGICKNQVGNIINNRHWKEEQAS